jgi:hypothetical protein
MNLKVPQTSNVFVIPVSDRFLLYSPFHDFAALVNHASVLELGDALSTDESVGPGSLQQVLQILSLDFAH